jgi:hypothetical protein
MAVFRMFFAFGPFQRHRAPLKTKAAHEAPPLSDLLSLYSA